MYKVIENFMDLKDNNHKYVAGDIFPRDGVQVSSTRINELATVKNRRGIKLIEEVKEEKPIETKVEAKTPAKKSGGKKKADAE